MYLLMTKFSVQSLYIFKNVWIIKRIKVIYFVKWGKTVSDLTSFSNYMVI